MASIIIQTENIRWRLTPLSSDKLYKDIRKGSQLRGGVERTEIYSWNCKTGTGTEKVPRKAPLVTRTDFRVFGPGTPAQHRLRYKAKHLDVLVATNLSPTGWDDKVNANFALPEVAINWQQFEALKPNQSFKIYLVIKYVYFIARPRLTNEQKKAPNIAPLDGSYVLIGLPVEWDIKVEFGAPCNGAEKAEDISSPTALPVAEPLKPLFDEHKANEERLNQFELPGNGWDVPEWGGPDTHDELEPDPSEFEDPLEEPVEEPLNPFEEWLFDLYDFIEEAEAFGGGGGGNGSGN